MGPLLFYPTSESDVSNKAVNVGQIIGKMGEAKIWLYTKYLLKNMQPPVLPVRQVPNPGVEHETNRTQSPWTSSSFLSQVICPLFPNSLVLSFFSSGPHWPFPSSSMASLDLFQYF
jgi:hypothetical protein